ncbi:TPA: hypothetical protein JDL67_000797 [Salmonella enterica subsp. salamae]|nr:hypothetical protein [Salmonella enterica subsp. salamae]
MSNDITALALIAKIKKQTESFDTVVLQEDEAMFAPECETDAQAYFNRESEIIDSELSKCMDFFMQRNEHRRAAAKSGAGVSLSGVLENE